MKAGAIFQAKKMVLETYKVGRKVLTRWIQTVIDDSHIHSGAINA